MQDAGAAVHSLLLLFCPALGACREWGCSADFAVLGEKRNSSLLPSTVSVTGYVWLNMEI